jgi:hypothetical protein
LTSEAKSIPHSPIGVIVVAYPVTIFVYKVVAWGLAVLATEVTPRTISPAVATEIAHIVTVFVREIVADAVAVFVHEAGTSDERCARSRALRQRQTGCCYHQQRNDCTCAYPCPKSPIPYHLLYLLELVCALIIPTKFE